MKFEFSPQVSLQEVSELRNSVGWNDMEECYKNSLKGSYFYICCYDKSLLSRKRYWNKSYESGN